MDALTGRSVRAHLLQKGPAKAASLRQALGMDYRMAEFSSVEGVRKTSITRNPLADGPMLDEEFVRYPRLGIGIHAGEMGLWPYESDVAAHYSVYYVDGQEARAAEFADGIRSHLRKERARAFGLAQDVADALARRLGSRDEFAILLGGDFSRTLGVFDRNSEYAPMLPQSDLDLHVFVRGYQAERVRDECASIDQRRRELSQMNSRHLMELDFGVFVEREVMDAARKFAQGIMGGHAIWLKDLMHAVPIDESGAYIRTFLSGHLFLRRLWQEMVAGSLGSEAEKSKIA